MATDAASKLFDQIFYLYIKQNFLYWPRGEAIKKFGLWEIKLLLQDRNRIFMYYHEDKVVKLENNGQISFLRELDDFQNPPSPSIPNRP